MPFFRAALLVAAAWPGVALAQAVPPVQPPQGNIEERARQQIRIPGASDGEDALMSGDSDIILLRKTKLFNLHGALEVSATDNAYLAPGPRVGDGYAQAQAGLGFATRIGGRVTVFADASVATVRYFEETALDYSAVTGAVGASADFGRLNITASYNPSVVFTRDFEDRQVTSHRFRLAASTVFKAGALTIQPEIHGERTISDPDDYSAWSGGGSLTLSGQPSANLPVLLFAQAGYDHRSFDDYFEAFVGVKRDDDNISAGVGAVWKPNPWIDVRASYNFGRNWSSSDVNRYRAHSGSFGVSAVMRF